MPTIPVKPELIHWAIDRSGISSAQLAEKFPKLEEWKSGDKQPTIKQLESFARATMTPFGSLFLSAPPTEVLPLPDFRTKDEQPLRRFSPNLLETIRSAQQRQAWMRESLVEEGAEPLDFVGSVERMSNVKTLAQKIRQKLELDPTWAEDLSSWEAALQTLRKATERIGIIVFSSSIVGLNNHRPLDPEEFRGFVLCDEFAPVVFLNDADTKSARIFSLAHELVHVWMGIDGVFNLENMLPSSENVERFCNEVAAEFLIPEHKLRDRWHEASISESPFHLIASWFKVSPVVAARRALDLELITKDQFFLFYEADKADWQLRLREDRAKKKAGGNFYATQSLRLGRRFSAAIIRAVREGRVTYQEAYRLTGMQGATFAAYADLVIKRVREERE
jgi:Zn-dependent peptidase ImmA (M78 family)